MPYQLWDAESGTLLGSYETEADALAVVQANVLRYGKAYVAARSLGRLEDATPSLEGPALVTRA